MTNNNPSIEERLQAAARALEPSSAFSAELWEKMSSEAIRRDRAHVRLGAFLRPAWIMVTVLFILVLAFLLVTPQRVVTAFKTLIGYLPGIGFVEDEPSTLYLEKPVRLEQDGITLIVDGAVADTQNTIVTYHIEGLSAGDAGVAMPCFYNVNELHLPDGKRRLPIGGGVDGGEATARVIFQSLPDGVESVTLYVARDDTQPGCNAPGSFSVDLAFGARPPDVTPLPVLEGGAQGALTVSVAPTPVSGTTLAADADFTFTIDRVVSLEKELLVVGHVTWQNPDYEYVQIDSSTIQVHDAVGNPLAVTPDEAGQPDNQFAFRLARQPYTAPLTLRITSVYVTAVFNNDAPTFDFDAGDHPQTGQTWEVNRDLDLLGYAVRVRSVSVVNGKPALGDGAAPSGYALEMENPANVYMIDVSCQDMKANPTQHQNGEWFQRPDGGITLKMYYEDTLPVGHITCMVRAMHFRLSGSWEMTWQPPETLQ